MLHNSVKIQYHNFDIENKSDFHFMYEELLSTIVSISFPSVILMINYSSVH